MSDTGGPGPAGGHWARGVLVPFVNLPLISPPPLLPPSLPTPPAVTIPLKNAVFTCMNLAAKLNSKLLSNW